MKLRDTTIYVVGVGGTGSHLANLLARYFSFNFRNSPKRLILVDDDKIEERNAERQMFNRLEMGQFKVDAIARRLKGFTNIEALPIRFDDTTLPKDLGLMSSEKASVILLICVDSAAARHQIWSHMIGPYDAETRQYTSSEPNYKGNFIVIDGGNAEYSGQVTTCVKYEYGEFKVMVGHDPRILFENVRNATQTVVSCQRRQEIEPQTVMANCEVATLMFNELISIIQDKPFFPLVKFDLTQRLMSPVGGSISIKELYQQWLRDNGIISPKEVPDQEPEDNVELDDYED